MRIEYLAEHPDFIPTLARWQHREWACFHPGETLQDRIDQINNQIGSRQIPTTVAALEDSEVFGSASLVHNDLETRPDLSPWLAGVYVGSQYRRLGIGTALVTRIMLEAQELGASSLYLFTADQEKLYAGLGWKSFEQQMYHGYPIVLMKLDLSLSIKTVEPLDINTAKKIHPR